MKRVLILAYDFPPYVSVGGLRPYSWYKYFHEFDLYPIVITRQWSNKYKGQLDYVAPGFSAEAIIEESQFGKIIRTPYFPNLANKIFLKYGEIKFKLIRRFLSSFYEIFQWLLPVGSKHNIYKYANDFLFHNDVDIIIATGDPFILFKYGTQLSKKYNLPFIADYRDLWSLNTERKGWLFYKWNKYLECKYIKQSKCIITVSDFLKNKISELYNNGPIYIINNGFDLDLINNINSQSNDARKLSISLAGTIYKWHPYDAFLKVINKIYIERRIEIELFFYGINIEHDIRSLINVKYPSIVDNIHFFPRMENKQVLQELKKSQLLLLFNYFYFMGTKIFDYLGLKRNILFCFSDDKDAMSLKNTYYPINEYSNYNDHLQQDLIEKTNSGYIIKNTEHLESKLIELQQEMKNIGEIKCHSLNTIEYSRENQAGLLAEIIKSICTQ